MIKGMGVFQPDLMPRLGVTIGAAKGVILPDRVLDGFSSRPSIRTDASSGAVLRLSNETLLPPGYSFVPMPRNGAIPDDIRPRVRLERSSHSHPLEGQPGYYLLDSSNSAYAQFYDRCRQMTADIRKNLQAKFKEEKLPAVFNGTKKAWAEHHRRIAFMVRPPFLHSLFNVEEAIKRSFDPFSSSTDYIMIHIGADGVFQAARVFDPSDAEDDGEFHRIKQSRRLLLNKLSVNLKGRIFDPQDEAIQDILAAAVINLLRGLHYIGDDDYIDLAMDNPFVMA